MIKDEMRLGLPNLGATVLVVAAVLLGAYGERSSAVWLNAGAGASGAAFWLLVRLYVRTIERYTPASSLAAKRANEQIKLLATFWSNIAVGIVTVLTFQALRQSPEQQFLSLSVGCGAAFFLHSNARGLLRYLKD